MKNQILSLQQGLSCLRRPPLSLLNKTRWIQFFVYLMCIWSKKKKARQDITICGVWRIKGGFSQPEEKMPLCCLVVWLQILLYPLAAAWTGWNQDWTVTQYFLLCCAIKSNLSLASWWNCSHFSAYCQQTGGQPIFGVVLQSRMMGVFLQANRFVNM